MGMDDKEELDDELVKSLERLVEEETSVAKAFVDNQKEISSEGVAGTTATVDADMGKTKVIPKVTPDMITKTEKDMQKTGIYNSDEVRASVRREPHNPIEDTNTDIYSDDNRNKEVRNVYDVDNAVRKNTVKPATVKSAVKSEDGNRRPAAEMKEKADTGKGMDASKKRLIITISCIVAVILAIAGVTAGVINHNKNKESYKYNYDKGMESYKNNEYDTAIKYLSKASKLNEGKKNAELKYTLYECYKEKDNTDMQIEVLKDILSFDENNENAIKVLAAIYEKKKDGTSLTELIKSYKDKDGYKYLSDYIVEEPKPSVEAGTYDDEQKLQFAESSSSTVYYTLDKSEPTSKSTAYSGSAIDIKKGTTTVKAVAVNSIGVYSNIVELVYTVDYKKPSAPSVSPESGTYSQGQQVTISNIPAGSNAYYTLDGSTPTVNSEMYTEPFDIPTGNNVISVIIVDAHNQTSTVVKRNYVVNKAKTFSYNECLDILKEKLITDGVLKSDGSTTKEGNEVTFVYQPKTTVDSVEMYIVRFDVTENSKTTTKGYYGIGIKDGTCYKVTKEDGSYSASEY